MGVGWVGRGGRPGGQESNVGWRSVKLAKFRLKEKFLASMTKIGPTTRLFLLNFRSHELFGPFSPDGKPALAIVPEAWKDKRSGRGAYPAQIRIATGGRYWKVAHHSRTPGPLDGRQTEELMGLLADSGTRGTVALGSFRENGCHNDHGSRTAAGYSAPTPQRAPAPAPAPMRPTSTTPSQPPIPGNTPGYLFVCTSATEGECFSRQLFGLGSSRLQSMANGIRESSTPIFLLNFKTRIVHGVFEAVGRPAMNIEADAWCGLPSTRKGASLLSSLLCWCCCWWCCWCCCCCCCCCCCFCACYCWW
eukprot:COSAG02_NODE_6586_length_3476_cov_2.239266_2_plen_305_part_00